MERNVIFSTDIHLGIQTVPEMSPGRDERLQRSEINTMNIS